MNQREQENLWVYRAGELHGTIEQLLAVIDQATGVRPDDVTVGRARTTIAESTEQWQARAAENLGHIQERHQ